MTDAPDKKEKPISRASAPKLLRKESDGVPAQVEFGTDSSTGITSLRTPAPLPPSPASQDAEGWFEHVATNPAAIPDLGALAGGGTDPGSVPAWALPPGSMDNERKSVGVAGPEASHYRWLLPLLLAATCLTVGMVLGAILQSRLGAPPAMVQPACPDPSAHLKPTTGKPTAGKPTAGKPAAAKPAPKK